MLFRSGGTHISNTGRIGTFRIISEGAIAAGIRRVEAVTAEACENYLYKIEDTMKSVKDAVSSNAPEIMTGLKKLMSENEEMKKRIHEYVKEQTALIKEQIIANKKEVNGVNLFMLDNIPLSPEIIKDIAFQIKGEFAESMAFVAATSFNEKPNLTVMLSDDMVEEGQIGRASCRERV